MNEKIFVFSPSNEDLNLTPKNQNINLTLEINRNFITIFMVQKIDYHENHVCITHLIITN